MEIIFLRDNMISEEKMKLKSDRFGMEIILKTSGLLVIYLIKIRPFRYGNHFFIFFDNNWWGN